MNWTALLAIFISLVLLGFFAGIEAAFLSANKLSIELRKKQGTYSGRRWGTYAENPTRFIGNALVGFTIMMVVYGLLWSNFMTGIWTNRFWEIENPYLHLVIETFIATAFLLVAEFSFRAFFRAKKDGMLGSTAVAYVVQVSYGALSWLSSLLIAAAEWLLRYLFNVKLNTRMEPFTKIDLEQFIQQSKNLEAEDYNELNKELFENALSLGDKKVRECLIPRKEVEAIEISCSIEDIRQKFISTKLSKLVVYEGHIDNILGYVHQQDLFKYPPDIRSVLLPISAIPETMPAIDLINRFTRERKTIAWVVDEFGGTAGIVTMEDLLEELFGEIRDEYDTEEFIDKQLADNEYIFSGRMELDQISEKYTILFPDRRDAETLSGYIIQHIKQIPRTKEGFTIGNNRFEILTVSDTRIESVKLKVLK
jgi:putative hemolysin